MADQQQPEIYLIERVRQALATDPQVGELAVKVAIVGHKVFLTGTVATDERREAIAAVVRATLPDYEVHNETTVRAFHEAPEAEHLG